MTVIDQPQFSTRLRQVTQDDHQSAESSKFITTLMAGERSARDYTLLISQYHYIYAALEQEVRRLAHQAELSPIFDLALERSANIDGDLAVLLPAHSFEQLPPALPATTEYVEAIHAAAIEPARLVAHHYLRYLGDLSGGLAIGKLVARHYGIAPEALNMWNFEQIEKPKLYKDRYRLQLDIFGEDETRAVAVLDEAQRGFQWNKQLFQELLQVSEAHLALT